MCGEISCFMEFVIKKQDKTDKGTSPEESFIQNSSWISVRREKNADFLRVRNPRSRLFFTWLLFSRSSMESESEESECFHFLAIPLITQSLTIYLKLHCRSWKRKLKIKPITSQKVKVKKQKRWRRQGWLVSWQLSTYFSFFALLCR